MDPSSLNTTGSLLWNASDTVSLKFSFDYLKDELADYWGTPLIPAAAAKNPMNSVISTKTGETLDEAMRGLNYNVENSRAESNQLFLRGDIPKPADNVTLKNTIYSNADREWLNAEGYVYCTEVVDVCRGIGEIQRYYGYFFVFHDQIYSGTALPLSSI